MRPPRGPRRRLVRGGGDEVGVRDRAGMQPDGHETRDVGHVHHHDGVHLRGHLRDAREIDDARVGAGPDHDHLGPVLARQLLECVVVDLLGVGPHAVGDDLVELPGEVERVPVGEVAAVGQVHPEHRVARLHRREVHRHVGLRARVRLHVGVVGAEERLGARDRQRLGHVHELAAAVVALAGIALGVFVGEHRAGGVEDRLADEVLGRDELEALGLATAFAGDGGGDLGVGFGERPQQGRAGQVHVDDCKGLGLTAQGMERLSPAKVRLREHVLVSRP